MERAEKRPDTAMNPVEFSADLSLERSLETSCLFFFSVNSKVTMAALIGLHLPLLLSLKV